MASFHEKDGMWGMRAKVRTKTGFQYQTTPFLWNSKSEAENDADLFVWYRSLEDSSDPLMPTRGLRACCQILTGTVFEII